MKLHSCLISFFPGNEIFGIFLSRKNLVAGGWEEGGRWRELPMLARSRKSGLGLRVGMADDRLTAPVQHVGVDHGRLRCPSSS